MGKGVILTTKHGAGGMLNVYGEAAAGVKDNSNRVFNTTGNYVFGTLKVYYNGQRLCSHDFNENGADEFVLTYVKPYNEDCLVVDYVLQNL